MALTPSTMMDLGMPIPSFSLPDVRSGAIVNYPEAGAPPKLVMFICKHCPFVVHVKGELARIGRDYGDRVSMVAISSNDVSSVSADSPSEMKKMADESGFTFPVCYDETQEVAKSYGAACTPDFFLFDAAGKLAYRGQLDGSRPTNGVPVDGRDLRAAMDALLKGERPSGVQRPSTGCNIKWRAGNQPDYAMSLAKR